MTDKLVPLDRLSKDIDFFGEFVETEYAHDAFLDFARDEIKEANDSNELVLGTRPKRDLFVDGREAKSVDGAPPGSTITAVFRLRPAINPIPKMLAVLERLSPVGRSDDTRAGHPGFYRRNHEVLANGSLVPRTYRPKPNDRLTFITPVIYGPQLEERAVRGIYRAAARRGKRAFGAFYTVRYRKLFVPASAQKGGDRFYRQAFPAVTMVPR